ncbi:hypothetical protein ABMA28_015202 [Loxostege sticticalis]|uniref:TATA-binding protein-associated factor 172 n=1 Tax=Loxostege sticticalis TaxID=481309 RepID=A0ABD0TEP3_LOXSC
MTSRLDRLFVLLEAGAGAATRRAAARQLGEVQKAHPEELHRLLSRLMKHLRSPAWETRVAASQAVEAILANVPEWHPPPFAGKKEEKEKIDLEESGRLRCETFDIERVLLNGAHLMGSEGHEYDLDEEAMSAAGECLTRAQREGAVREQAAAMRDMRHGACVAERGAPDGLRGARVRPGRGGDVCRR